MIRIDKNSFQNLSPVKKPQTNRFTQLQMEKFLFNDFEN